MSTDKIRPGRKRSPDSESTLKPWIKEGISRTAWYARKRELELIRDDRKIYDDCGIVHAGRREEMVEKDKRELLWSALDECVRRLHLRIESIPEPYGNPPPSNLFARTEIDRILGILWQDRGGAPTWLTEMIQKRRDKYDRWRNSMGWLTPKD